MARFNELAEQDRIQYIKDGFILILEQLAKDPSKLKNYIKLEKPKESTPELEATYKAKEDAYKKIEEIVSKLQKKEGCMCGSCMNTSITNNVIAPELDVLIDAARKEAEERSY